MKRRQEIINQIVFILIIIFITFLLWGYGAGWLGASADVNSGQEETNFVQGISNGVKKIWQKPIFQEERDWPFAL